MVKLQKLIHPKFLEVSRDFTHWKIELTKRVNPGNPDVEPRNHFKVMAILEEKVE